MNKKNIRYRIVSGFFACSAVFVWVACSSADLGSKPPLALQVDAANPTWGNGIQALLAAKCDSCHAKELTKFTPENARPYRYEFSVSEAKFKASYLTLVQNSVFKAKPQVMPPNYATPLSADELAALQKYIESALAAAPAAIPSSGPTSTTLTFLTDIKAITDTSCARSGCHSTSGGSSIPLSSAAQFKTAMANATSSNTPLARINAQNMPLGNTTNFSTSDNGKKVIEWLSASSEVK